MNPWNPYKTRHGSTCLGSWCFSKMSAHTSAHRDFVSTESDQQDPRGGRDPIPTSCLLTFTHTLWHAEECLASDGFKKKKVSACYGIFLGKRVTFEAKLVLKTQVKRLYIFISTFYLSCMCTPACHSMCVKVRVRL